MEATEAQDTQEIGFANKYKAAIALCDKAKTLAVTNAQEHRVAAVEIESIRQTEKELEESYKTHPIIISARNLQSQKVKLAEELETTRKDLKRRQIIWEDIEEEKRKAEERRIAEEQRKLAEEEARIAKFEADRQAAQALEAAELAEKNGNAQAAENYLAQAEAKESAGKEAIAHAAVTPTVVLPRTAPKTAHRTTVKKWSITTKSGKVYRSDQMTAATRIPAEDLKEVLAEVLMLNPMAVTGLVKRLGKAAESKMVGLSVWEEAA